VSFPFLNADHTESENGFVTNSQGTNCILDLQAQKLVVSALENLPNSVVQHLCGMESLPLSKFVEQSLQTQQQMPCGKDAESQWPSRALTQKALPGSTVMLNSNDSCCQVQGS
jgi:hypothetical protein